MDGQNLQNEQNEQNTNNSYQDNTQQYAQQNVQPAYTQAAPAQTPAKTPTLAIVSLVMGILSIVMGCCYGIGIIFAIAGIIMAVIANKQQKSGIGVAGLVCSIIGAVFSAIMLVYYIVALGALLGDPDFMDSIMDVY